MRASLVLIAMVLVGSAQGCKPTTSPPSSPEAEARQIFAERCAPCHGAQGAGNGAAAAALNPAPRDFHDPAWQASVTDARIEEIITRGGAAVGKSPLMPPNPDLNSKPAVVAALRATIRAMH